MDDLTPRIRVLIADDHGVVRRGLRGFFELLDDMEIAGEARHRARNHGADGANARLQHPRQA